METVESLLEMVWGCSSWIEVKVYKGVLLAVTHIFPPAVAAETLGLAK